MSEAPWFVYLLQCRSGKVYTGVTPLLEVRMKAHKTGKGALFTRMDPPQRLLAAKPFSSKREALQIERQVKGLSAQFKQHLAAIWSQQHPIDEFTQERLALL
jgi:putative endonuclease